MVLRRMFWPRKNEVTRKWRRLHNAELYALYSPNVIPVIRTGRQMGRTCGTHERKGTYTDIRVWWESVREGDHLKDPDADVKIILKWILEKWVGSQTRSIWLRIGTGTGLL